MRQRCLQLGGLGLALLTPLLLNPWAALPFEPVKVSFVRGVTLLLLLVVIGAGLGRQQRHWYRLPMSTVRLSPFAGAVLLYGIVLLVTTATSFDPSRSWWGASDRHGALTTGCGLLLFGLLRRVLHSARHVSHHLLAWVAGSVPVCLYGLVQAGGVDPLAWHTDSVSPVLSTLGRSNNVGVYLALVIPLTLHLAWIGWRQQRRGAVAGVGVILLLQCFCLALTQARAGWVAFLGGVALWWWYAPLPQDRRQRIVGLLVFGLICVALFTTVETTVEIVVEQEGAAPPTEPGQSATGPTFVERRSSSVERRWTIWQHTLPLVGERWLLGYGPEMFGDIFQRRYPPGSLYDGADNWVDDPHNLLLDQLMASGMMGAMAWLLLIGLFYRQTDAAAKRSPASEGRSSAAALLGAMTAYVIQAQFTSDTIVPTIGFWLFLTYAAALPTPCNHDCTNGKRFKRGRRHGPAGSSNSRSR